MKIVIVGGCGHVGLPLGVSLASPQHYVTAFDTDKDAVKKVNSGEPPFNEPGLEEKLLEVINRNFKATSDPNVISFAEVVIVVIGTPLDKQYNPDPVSLVKVIRELLPYLRENQLLILRSTVYPGVTKIVERTILESGKKIMVSFCPERIAEGYAMNELRALPQIIGARDATVFESTKLVFDILNVESIRTTPEEAELAKLFTNAWRYIKFAIANQFWIISNESEIDFEKIRKTMVYKYPRAQDLPAAGFTAGPCLLKDTLQLYDYSLNDFGLGHAAIQINEGLPNYIVNKLKENYELANLTVGILGMAFKGESDDARSSLAYRLKKILEFHVKSVLTSDPFVKSDTDLVSEQTLLDSADLIIIGAPHRRYSLLEVSTPVIDIWSIVSNRVELWNL